MSNIPKIKAAYRARMLELETQTEGLLADLRKSEIKPDTSEALFERVLVKHLARIKEAIIELA